jgi:hypothetical protein
LQRHQFEAYLDNVFDWSDRVDALREGRQRAHHPWRQVLDTVFLGTAVQIPNLHRLEAECRAGVLAQRIGALSEDTMGHALQRKYSASVFALGCAVARHLERNVPRSKGARWRPVPARAVRVVKGFRVQKVRRVQITGPRRGKKQKTRQTVPQESTNYYAMNLEFGSIPRRFIYEQGLGRWRLDTEVFPTLSTQAHLKQPSVHQTYALVQLTMIRVLAYKLSLVFYHRQVVSHARQTPSSFSATAWLLAYLFLPPRLDTC